MNALHTALENATCIYYKPGKLALWYISRPQAFAMIFLSVFVVSIFALIGLSFLFTFWKASAFIFVPQILVFLALSYQIGKERKMLDEVLAVVKVETGIDVPVDDAREMMLAIIVYTYGKNVIAENE